MEPRVTTTIVGLLTLIVGVLALFFPEFIMAYVLGFAVHPSYPAAFVHGEVRAAYGGLFTVIGVATVLAAMDPATHRSRILFVGLLWLGACGGRMWGVVDEGNPGMWGWLSAVFEAVMGGALVVVSQGVASSGPRPVSEHMQSYPVRGAPRSSEPPADEPSI